MLLKSRGRNLPAPLFKMFYDNLMHPTFMHRCLTLAALGRGSVGNGALVGSVLVRDGKIIAEGHHQAFGKSHAERSLLENYSGDILPTDILYVNLEPCCHTGKQPPCTDIILERRIKHVVIGMQDPDVRVAGKGIEILRKSGVTVEGPVLRAECEWLNRGFVSVRTKQRPWITLKMAHTIDGRIANADGSKLASTSPEQNVWSHTHLRMTHDAILIGVQTEINDNPRLDTRLAQLSSGYQPWRIILDPHARIPQVARVLIDEHAARTIVLVAEEKMADAQSFSKKGALVFPLTMVGGSFDWEMLWKALLSSNGSFNGVTSVLVEGGQRTWDLFKKAKMVDMEVSLIGEQN